MQCLVSVIIVTCGVNDYLKRCLDSVMNQIYKNLEIIIIDNSLNRNFGEKILRYYPGVKIYTEEENLFYTGALNKGITVSQGRFILCINDDVVLDRLFIRESLRGFSLDASIGMISGKVLRNDGVTIDSTGLFLTPWRTSKERGYGRRNRNQFDRPGYIFGVTGAVAFYRRDMLESIRVNSEYFDSDFRMFYEDLDIAWRGKLFGWKAYYLPQAIAYHIRGGTARQQAGIDRPIARRYIDDALHLDLIKNRYLTIIKNESVFSLLLHLPFIIGYDFLVFGYIIFFSPHLLKRIFTNLRYITSSLRKRRIILDKKNKRHK